MASLFVSFYQDCTENCGLVTRMYLKLAVSLQMGVMSRLKAGQQDGFIIEI